MLNDVSRADIGFNSDRNEVTIVTAEETISIPEASKLDVAVKILKWRCEFAISKSTLAQVQRVEKPTRSATLKL